MFRLEVLKFLCTSFLILDAKYEIDFCIFPLYPIYIGSTKLSADAFVLMIRKN